MAATNSIPIETTPVLIIGSSMVGMTLSALLAKHGVRGCITVEKHSSTAIHPRAALFHPRTMQIYRELDLFDTMVAESAKHYDQHAGIVDIESLAGKFNGTWMKNMNEGIENLSPVVRLFLTQQMFEPLLRDSARAGGADLRFSTEMVGFSADANDGVTARVRNTDTGKETIIRAQYMVACDGSRSGVRQALNIKMKGHGLLSHSLTIYFNMDVGKYVKGKYNGVIYVNNPTVRGFFRLDKNGREGFLVVNTAGEQGTKESRYPADDITDERAAELLRTAIGADVDFEITLIAKWQAVCDVAEDFSDRTGRVLLAGDCAHVVTPQGGFGGNTGVQDAHNLAWKLALVLSGKAGPELLQTYEQERHPVCEKTVAQVFERYIKRTAPELRAEYENAGVTIEEEATDSWLELGYRYHSQALDTTSLGSVIEDPATSPALPGSMAHHVHIALQDDDAGEPRPIADLLGQTFVLMLGSEANGWAKAAELLASSTAAKRLPPIRTHWLKKDTDAAFCAKYGITASGAVLIRPDGFVAWSAPEAPPRDLDPATTLLRLMERILCLKPFAAS